MNLIRKTLLAGATAAAILAFVPAANASVHQKPRQMLTKFTRIASKGQPRKEAKKTNQPVYGTLNQNYTNWTLNGKLPLWSAPANAGKRYRLLNPRTVSYIAAHAKNTRKASEPNQYRFFLDYTATYNNNKLPNYYFISSMDPNSNLKGWVYRTGLRSVGNINKISINTITNQKDVITPTKNYISKTDRADAWYLRNNLVAATLSKDTKGYNGLIRDSYWEANYLGTINQRTRAQKRQLIRNAIKQANQMLQHAKRSKSYLNYLTKDNYANLLN